MRQIFVLTMIVAICAGPNMVAAAACPGEIVAAGGQPVPFEEVLSKINTAGGALLGERHGVRGHPQALACLAKSMRSEEPLVLVFEMLAADQQGALDAYRSQHPELVDGLGTALKWWTTGWPSWPVYQPAFAAGWMLKAKVVAGDRSSAATVPAEAELGALFGGEWPRVQSSWATAMKEAHCGLIADEKAEALALKQSARDVTMARAVTGAQSSNAVVLLYAGRAHVRTDRSVGVLLRQSNLKTAMSAGLPSVALYETAVAGVPVDRSKILAEAKGRYDYVWFTGTATQPDPCERLRRKGLISTAGAKP